jgi:hypothetical protein
VFSIPDNFLSIWHLERAIHLNFGLTEDQAQKMSFLQSLSSGITVGEVAGLLNLGVAIGTFYISHYGLYVLIC